MPDDIRTLPADTENAFVKVTVTDHIARIVLNRPGQRNPLSRGMMTALKEELDAIHERADIHVVIIAATGPAFCAGHDLKEMHAARGEDGRPNRPFMEALFKQCSDLMLTVQRIRQPVIAEVQAIATAAGCQLVATCDLAIASSTARFATPGVNLGLFCSTPMVALSRAVPRKAAMEMLLLGDLTDAETAQRFGLINRIVPPEELEAATWAVAKQIADKSPLVLEIGKRAFYHQIERPVEDAYAYASEVMTTNMMARDAEEGIGAFMEKRKPEWSGS